MKKYQGFILLFMVSCVSYIVLSMPSVSDAQWSDGYSRYSGIRHAPMGVGFRLGFVDFDCDDINSPAGVSIPNSIDKTMSFGINSQYFFNEFASLEMSIDHIHKSDIFWDIAGTKMDIGDITITPILFTVRYHFPTDMQVGPYIGAGFGYHFNKFEKGNAANQAGIAISSDNTSAFHLNAGTKIFPEQFMNVSFDIDLKYVLNQSKTKTLGWNAYMLGFGVSYYF